MNAEVVHALRRGVNQVLWVEQLWNGHPQNLDSEIFEDCPSAKIAPLKNFPLPATQHEHGKCLRWGEPGIFTHTGNIKDRKVIVNSAWMYLGIQIPGQLKDLREHI